MKFSNYRFLAILLIVSVHVLIPSCRAGVLSFRRKSTPVHIRDAQFLDACKSKAPLEVLKKMVSKVSTPALEEALLSSIRFGYLRQMRLILKALDKNPDYVNPALLYAIEHDRLYSVQELLKYPGLNLSFQDDNHHNALMKACINGSAPIVELVAKKGLLKQALHRDLDGRTPLMHASAKGHKDVVKILLKEFPFEKFVIAKDNRNQTALTLAAGKEVATLLQKVVSVEDRLNEIERETFTGPIVKYDLISEPKRRRSCLAPPACLD